jgi:hypothetical protein
MLRLAQENAHPRDSLIAFFDDHGQHEYVIYEWHKGAKRAIDGNCREKGGTYKSVTSWTHSGFKPFEHDAVIASILQKARKGDFYYGLKAEEISGERLEVRQQVDPATGESQNVSVKVEEGLWPTWRDAGSIMHDQIELYYNGCWTFQGLEHMDAAGRLKFAQREHAQFRAFSERFPHLVPRYNEGHWTPEMAAGREPLPVLSPELELFRQFAADHPHLQAYRTEWCVFDRELRLMGAIDMLFWDRRLQAFAIYDWKRSRRIRPSSFDGECGCAWWACHVHDCNLQHYSLQLSTYALILARNYGIVVREMWLVRLHPSERRYEKIQVHWDEALMQNMVAERLRTIAGLPERPYVPQGASA